MRTIIVAGNWKSHKTQAEAIELINGMRPALDGIKEVENIIFPPYLSIPKAAELLDGSKISLGAQNMNWEVQGAFTGEVGPTMVKEFCSYILIGHSERRQYYGETDETVNKRTKQPSNMASFLVFVLGNVGRKQSRQNRSCHQTPS